MRQFTPPLLFAKCQRVCRCRWNHFLKTTYQFIKRHPAVQRFCFDYTRHFYTALRYRMTFGEWMSFRHPSSFHEKLFWLSVNYRHPLIMQCADKYRVRKYIEQCGCGDILNELYGAYDRVEDIPFEQLPSRFVIKSNRGSGDNFFCLDKPTLDYQQMMQTLSQWKEHIYGVDTAEYQYAKMPFKLVCEKYLLENPTDEMMEYQFFCFNGVPASILVRSIVSASSTYLPVSTYFSISSGLALIAFRSACLLAFLIRDISTFSLRYF